MKKSILLFILLVGVFKANAQSTLGAWEGIYGEPGKKSIKISVLVADGYLVTTVYDTNTGAFIGTSGGSWERDGNLVTEYVEFDSNNPERVGTKNTYELEFTANTIRMSNSDIVFARVDNGTPGALAGAWLMSGRIRDGELQTRDTGKPRKTMKILSGSRFQWIAYNTETKAFMGTGGGTYTTENGTYQETIQFFSKDPSKVGMSLSFDYELKEGDWHHSGTSSKGDPIHEIWSIRE
ncbi:membrane or secreted protein [Flavobacterium sp. ASW18X]|uniref:membrane or secreted protein n=1 Tax=Flavobacterium sp. ASW18X TaxID=2572595 RepID=UPI0010ADFCCD|nr:membrane or secreted protein [Flavobacterium sp. ASW18X]TKD59155.1 membrane or secreted protein [Flavobacterium sp. ASW18X]